MSEPSSRRLPSDRRPARRSLVELTAVASRALQEGLPLAPASATVDPPPCVREETEAILGVREVKAEAAGQTASSAALAVEIAKDFQARALEDLRLGMNAALDYARGLVEKRVPQCEASKDRARPEQPVVTGLGAAAEYRAESVELLKSNVESAMDYARALAQAKTPAEFIALSSEHARKQCEFALKQAGALKSLARSATNSGSSDQTKDA
jgi:phasin protein